MFAAALSFSLLFLGLSSQVWTEEINEDVELDRLMTHHREKRVLCNTVTSQNQAGMARTWGKLFGKRVLINGINCTMPTVSGAPVDSCDYSNSASRPTGFGGSSPWTKLFGKRDQSKFIGKPKRDIVFLIDDSGSISASSFNVAKQGTVNLFTSFCPEKLGVEDKQIAVVLFSSNARTVISFKDSHQGSDWLATKIQVIGQSRGSTATAEGLRHVRENVLASREARLNDPDTSTHVIVVTDGNCNQGCQSLKSEAKKLREMGPGVQLFALGVSNARACELDIITGNGADLAFGVSDYNSFESFAKAMRQVAKDDYNGCI